MVLTMARPKDKNYDYRSGSSLLKKQQETNTKKYKAMTPAQKKAYNVKQAKAIGKTTAQVASMVGGVGIARAAGRKVVVKALARNLRNSPKGAPNVPTPKGAKLRETYYKSRTKASKARERGGIYNDGEGSFLVRSDGSHSFKISLRADDKSALDMIKSVMDIPDQVKIYSNKKRRNEGQKVGDSAILYVHSNPVQKLRIIPFFDKFTLGVGGMK